MSDDAQRPELTIMTFNVGNGLATPELLVRLLRHSGADVIGLQELSAEQADASGSRQARQRYPYRIVRRGRIRGARPAQPISGCRRKWITSSNTGRTCEWCSMSMAGR